MSLASHMAKKKNTSGCIIPGCKSPFYGDSLCRKHFARKKRGNNPYEKSMVEKTLSERIEEKIIRIPESGCWIWIASLNNKGYGQISGKYAHRVSYELVHGPIPDGALVLHSCDVSCCVNPNHLRLGSQKENMNDAIVRGRIAKGNRLPQYKHGKYSKYG